MKKILTLICTLLCANVLMAQTRFWVDSLRYEVINLSNLVEVYDANSSITTANIPATVSYNGTTYSVISIGESAFYECYYLTSVTLPNSVTSIGEQAFYDCFSLTSITIPNSVTSIGESAFKYCYSLTSVTLPENATIESNAFAGTFNTIYFTIDNIKYRTTGTECIIGNYTFNNVGNITFYLNGNTYNLILIMWRFISI